FHVHAALRDDAARVVVVRAEDADLAAELVLAPDQRLIIRVVDEALAFDGDVGVAGIDAGRGAAFDENEIALGAAEVLRRVAWVVELFVVFVAHDAIRQRLVGIADVAVAVQVILGAERHRRRAAADGIRFGDDPADPRAHGLHSLSRLGRLRRLRRRRARAGRRLSRRSRGGGPDAFAFDQQDVAGIDPVRVGDPGVRLPKLRPQIGVAELRLGKTPQR